MSFAENLRSRLRSTGAPVTTGLIVLLAGCFMAIWLTLGHPDILGFLAFLPERASTRPWCFLTYPFATSPGAFIAILFACLWLWSIGGAVEHDLGSGRYLLLWLLATLLGSLAVYAGSLMKGIDVPLLGPVIPLAALTVMWGTRNPGVMVRFMFVLPIAGMWLAFIAAGIVLFDIGAGPGGPLIGMLACLPLIASWLYASNRMPGLTYGAVSQKRKAWKPSERDDRYFEEVRRREQERDERERLRKLFEGSLKDDDDQGSASR